MPRRKFDPVVRAETRPSRDRLGSGDAARPRRVGRPDVSPRPDRRDKPVGLRRVSEGGLPRWVSDYPDGRASDHFVAAGSVSALVRSGLLAASEADLGLLVLTAKGRATCEACWRRRAKNDVALPRESVRA